MSYMLCLQLVLTKYEGKLFLPIIKQTLWRFRGITLEVIYVETFIRKQ